MKCSSNQGTHPTMIWYSKAWPQLSSEWKFTEERVQKCSEKVLHENFTTSCFIKIFSQIIPRVIEVRTHHVHAVQYHAMLVPCRHDMLQWISELKYSKVEVTWTINFIAHSVIWPPLFNCHLFSCCHFRLYEMFQIHGMLLWVQPCKSVFLWQMFN